MNIAFTNGKYLNASQQWQDFEYILIRDGRIVAIDGPDRNADQTFDARGKYLLPGLTDLSVALREPGFTAKGTIASETAAAAAAGITTLCATPDSKPVNDTKAVTKLIEELAEESAMCLVLPLGALTAELQGEQLAEYASLKNAGCVALSNGFSAIKNLSITKRCFEYAKTHDLTVFVNPIEPSLHTGVMHEGAISTTIGLQGISPLAETLAVSHLIKIAQSTGVRLHLSQLSCAGSVQLLAQAKSEGMRISADVALQNLLYTDAAVEYFNSVFHCEPPLRGETDRQALLNAVNDGVIDAITSCHRPHEAAAKQMPFAETEPGMSTLDILLPCAWALAQQGELPFECFIRAMTVGANKILQHPTPGIAIGAIADLCLFDPGINWQVQEQTLISEGKNSPWLGHNAQGKVRVTLCDGSLVFNKDAGL